MDVEVEWGNGSGPGQVRLAQALLMAGRPKWRACDWFYLIGSVN